VAALFRTTIVGRENLPATGGVVLAGNHVSHADPVLLWSKSPRPVHFMTKSEMWDSAVLGWFLDRFWAFPVRRGLADRTAIARATEYLSAGEPIGIFPEGTLNPDGTIEPKGGAAFIALRSAVPIVPVGIAGTDRIMPAGARMMRFPKVVISFGSPIACDPIQGARKQQVEAVTAEIMRRVGEEVVRAREVAGS
jgi:1-acyl-sn-glycerol-3-phosphate acyltransferase